MTCGKTSFFFLLPGGISPEKSNPEAGGYRIAMNKLLIKAPALLTVIADGLHGASLKSLVAESNLIIRHRLLADEGKTLVIIT